MFTSLANLKSFCNVTDTSQDAFLTTIIDRVEADLDDRAQSFGGKILQATYTDETYDISFGETVIETKRFPIASCPTVKVLENASLLVNTTPSSPRYTEEPDRYVFHYEPPTDYATTGGTLTTYTYTTTRTSTPYVFTKRHVQPLTFYLFEGFASAFVTYTAGFASADVPGAIVQLAFDLSVEKYLDSLKKESRFGKTSDSPNVTGGDSKSYERFTDEEIEARLTLAFKSVL